MNVAEVGPQPRPLVIVFTGGEQVQGSVTDRLPADALVIAADSGIDRALAAGRRVDLAVGDFDSVSAEGLDQVMAAGGSVETHERDKDQTDFELALDRALGLDAERVIVVGGHGGRIDHFLANIAVLTSDRYRTLRVEAWFGDTRAYVVREFDELTIGGEPGDIVTLIAVGTEAQGVTTRGLRFPLDHETLLARSSRGVSNEFAAGSTSAVVTVRAGAVLVIQPNP